VGYNNCVTGPTFETRCGEGLLVECSTAFRTGTCSPSITTFTARKKASRRSRRRPCSWPKAPPDVDGYPEDGIFRVSRELITIPINRKHRPSGITITHGITRLNIYAGLFGVFNIRDKAEDTLNLPSGQFEIPLVIYDRSFRRDGSLDYPDSGMPDARGFRSLWRSHVVNGRIFPYLTCCHDAIASASLMWPTAVFPPVSLEQRQL